VGVDGDEIALGDDTVNLDVDGPDRREEVLERLAPVPRLRVVLKVVIDDQVVEGVEVGSPERVEDTRDRLLVPLGIRHRGSSSSRCCP